MSKPNIVELKDQIESLASEVNCEVKWNNEYDDKGEITKYGLIIQASTNKTKQHGHDSPPKGYPDTKTEYADPKNYKYPVNSAERVRAAWSYINMPKNQHGYSASEVSAIKSRIKRAAKKFGVEINEK